MKKLFLILFPLVFFGCSNEPKYKALAVSIDCNNPGNVRYVAAGKDSYLEVLRNETFYGNYFSMTLQNEIIQVLSVKSSNPSVVSVISVDPIAYRFTLQAINAGEAKINVISKNCGSGTSLGIIVK